MKKIRAVNLGGWFVLEKWMKPSMLDDNFVDGNDETKFSEQVQNKEQIMYDHYKTWITKEDIIWLKESGINLVRIPIPWWLYGEEPYVRSVKHLDDAIEMISEVGMDFMLDLHTAPGCQNGFDNGGIQGVLEWPNDVKNIELTIEVLEKISKRYKDYPHFHSLGLLNEPFVSIDLDIVMKFHFDAYKRVRKILPDTYIVFHDSFRLNAWEDFFRNNEFHNVILDTHMYQCFDSHHHKMSIEEHVEAALKRKAKLAKIEEYVPVIVGEWSLGLRENEYITSQTSDMAMAKYASAQLESMRECTGHVFWSYKIENPNSGWNFKSLVDKGIIKLEEFLK